MWIGIVTTNPSSKSIFFKVYFPLAYPAIFAGSILAIMETLSDYGTVLYFGVETFSFGILKVGLVMVIYLEQLM